MTVAEEAIRKATVRVNTPLELWGCTNSNRYHADRFQTYRNCPNKLEPDVTEHTNRSIQEHSKKIYKW